MTNIPASPGADPVPAAVAAWASRPGSARLLAQVREKLEDGNGGDRVRVGGTLTGPERNDVARLLGMAWGRTDKPATLGLLRRHLGRHGSILEDLVAYQVGPIRDLAGERRQARSRRQATLDEVAALLTTAGFAEPVVDLARARPWLGPADRRHRVAADVVTVLTAAAEADFLLPTLAARLFGSPHALDRNTVLGRACVRLLAAQAAAIAGEDPATAGAAATSGHGWRAAWSRAGVTCDKVSCTVLVLNLPLYGDGSAAVLTRAAIGEPLWVTARMLETPWSPPTQLDEVWLVENPSVVEEAAAVLGGACRPLVCTYGQPSTAAWTLLGVLADAGTTVHVSADRDQAGAGISSALLAALPGSVPWAPVPDAVYEEDVMALLLAELDAGNA